MRENDKPVLIYSTFPTKEAAEEAGTALIEEQLAACVNILPGMTSIYRWEGKIARDEEVVMIIKTKLSRADAAIISVKERHSYDNPALIVIPIESGSPQYLDWLAEETGGKRE